MLQRFSVNFAIFSMLMDALSVLSAIYLANVAYNYWFIPLNENHLTFFVYLIAPSIWVFVFLILSVYNLKRPHRITEELQRLTLGEVISSLVFAGVLFFSSQQIPHLWLIIFFTISFALLIIWRLCVRILWRLRGKPPFDIRVLIVGAGETGRRIGKNIKTYECMGIKLVGYLDDNPEIDKVPILGTLEQIREVICKHNIDEVIITLPRRAYQRLEWVVETISDLPVQVRIIPNCSSLALWCEKYSDFLGVPAIELRSSAINEHQLLIKRIFDLIIGGIATLILLPIMGIVAIAIKLDSRGPILFRQQRVGENGRLFTMYKFRSMVVDAEKLQDQVNEIDDKGRIIHKKPNDPRVTRIGRFIRRYSLDELPQLFNVLKGDMSLVGPRPELPWLVEKYEPWQRKRFSVPQGITGWWQVNGRSERPMHLSTEDDLYYIENYSFWLDIYILFKTLWVVLKGKGAY